MFTVVSITITISVTVDTIADRIFRIIVVENRIVVWATGIAQAVVIWFPTIVALARTSLHVASTVVTKNAWKAHGVGDDGN